MDLRDRDPDGLYLGLQGPLEVVYLLGEGLVLEFALRGLFFEKLG